jgi:hypothetical protein
MALTTAVRYNRETDWKEDIISMFGEAGR